MAGTSGRDTEGRRVADKFNLDAEQHKVSLPRPKGNFDFEKFLQNMDDDDQFFHVTCHIEQGLRDKIARGEFVNLDKLLPKDKGGCGGNIPMNGVESKVELVSKDGHTYFRPVKDSQVNGLRKSVYAAIYTEANPERAAEIWQYCHTINIAASSYHWDNVAYYDVTFRQLMSFKTS